jgi:predicted nucleic acid-binding protein
MKYIFDSNVFDFLLENGITPERVAAIGEIFITNVQLTEIGNTPDQHRRMALRALVEAVQPRKLPTLSGVWDDGLPWDDEAIWIDDVSPEFMSLLGNAAKEFSNRDPMIGDVAFANGLTRVTSDTRFAKRASQVGISVVAPGTLFPSR